MELHTPNFLVVWGDSELTGLQNVKNSETMIQHRCVLKIFINCFLNQVNLNRQLINASPSFVADFTSCNISQFLENSFDGEAVNTIPYMKEVNRLLSCNMDRIDLGSVWYSSFKFKYVRLGNFYCKNYPEYDAWGIVFNECRHIFDALTFKQLYPDTDKNVRRIEKICGVRRFPPKRKATDVDGEQGWIYRTKNKFI